MWARMCRSQKLRHATASWCQRSSGTHMPICAFSGSTRGSQHPGQIPPAAAKRPGYELVPAHSGCSCAVMAIPTLMLVAGSWAHVPPAVAERPGYELVPSAQRMSSCAVEAGVPWRSLQALTPDATQLAPGAAWAPEPYQCAVAFLQVACGAHGGCCL